MKTIRLKSLIKFSNLNVSDIKDIFFDTQSLAEKKIDLESSSLAERIDFPFEYTEEMSDFKSFFDDVNLGGLCCPSDILYIATIHAYEFYSYIFRNEELKSTILSSSNPRAVFVKCFEQKLKDEDNVESLCSMKCENNHPFMKNVKSVAVVVI